MDSDLFGPAPWEALASQVRAHGPATPSRLARRIGLAGSRRETEDRVVSLTFDGPTLVGLPTGEVSHLVHVLDRCWFTKRVRAATTRRRDLWATSALAPVVTALIEAPIPLASGAGLVGMSDHLHPAIVGPPDWIPDVPAGGLVALRFVDGALGAIPVTEPLGGLVGQQAVRELVGRHYATERWQVDDEPTTRITLTRALAGAVLEVPDLLRRPQAPMDELLLDPLQEQHRHVFRDLAAGQQMESVSISLWGIPRSLHNELSRRAQLFGMALDQYVIAVLGHLAWRTPFAEDLEPWDGWVAPRGGGALVPLRPSDDDSTA